MTLPLYAYRCTQCGHRFEKIQHFSDAQEHECPKCHGVLERPLTAPALSFKGTGWYVNDYASKSSAPASESGSESGKGSDATETKRSSDTGETKSSAPDSTPSPAPVATSPSASTPGTTS